MLPASSPITFAEARPAGAAIHELVFGRLHHHVIHRVPSAAEVEFLVHFSSKGATR